VNKTPKWFTRTLYIPELFLPVWTKFIEICDREGSSGSEKIREYVRDYVREHEPGNPQRLLDPVLKRGSYEDRPICSFCEEMAAFKIFITDSVEEPTRARYACKTHRDFYKKRGPVYGEHKLSKEG